MAAPGGAELREPQLVPEPEQSLQRGCPQRSRERIRFLRAMEDFRGSHACSMRPKRGSATSTAILAPGQGALADDRGTYRRSRLFPDGPSVQTGQAQATYSLFDQIRQAVVILAFPTLKRNKLPHSQ